MSDSSSSPEPAPRKRKSTGSTGGRLKKPRQDYTAAKTLIDEILSAGGTLGIDASDTKALAEYARHLEEQVISLKPKEKTPAEIDAAAAKLRSATVNGIRKQMTWKDSCKTGSARWVFDGVCSDPVIFGAMMNLDAPPKWKSKKFTPEEFEDFMGDCSASVRYDNLVLAGNINVNYKAAEGTFKMSGSYGAPRHMNKHKSNY